MNNASLQTTWNELLRALYAPIDQDFNPFYWIYRLVIVLLDSIIPCRSHDRKQKLHGLLRWIRPVIPAVGIVLIVLCGWSYFTIFRYTVVRKRWCGAETATPESSACHWEMSHACLVIFFVVNIMGQYLWCIFRSPGVVEAVPGIHSEGTNSFDIEHSNQQPSTTIYHPDPNPTYCKRCELNRPARAHHCRVCNKCILQYDHHCPWVNNCIGYNNYRSFVLLVFHLMAGCTYGVILLGRDFFEMMKRRIELYGWSIRGAVHGTGLLDLPLPWVLWREYQSNGYIDRDVVLRAAFPLMFLVGIFMYWFLGYHLKIIIHGYTTLEDASRPRNEAIVNPYDNGPRNNLKKVFGTSWVRLLLPLYFLPPNQFSKPRT